MRERLVEKHCRLAAGTAAVEEGGEEQRECVLASRCTPPGPTDGGCPSAKPATRRHTGQSPKPACWAWVLCSQPGSKWPRWAFTPGGNLVSSGNGPAGLRRHAGPTSLSQPRPKAELTLPSTSHHLPFTDHRPSFVPGSPVTPRSPR